MTSAMTLTPGRRQVPRDHTTLQRTFQSSNDDTAGSSASQEWTRNRDGLHVFLFATVLSLFSTLMPGAGTEGRHAGEDLVDGPAHMARRTRIMMIMWRGGGGSAGTSANARSAQPAAGCLSLATAARRYGLSWPLQQFTRGRRPASAGRERRGSTPSCLSP